MLVALGVFGFRHDSSAAVNSQGVYIIGSRPLGPVTGAQFAGGNFNCGNFPGARQVNTTNFPTTPSSLFFSTGTSTASPTGLPLVEIFNLSAATSVLDTTNPLFVNQSF